jgi:hypothetical protein
MCSLAGGRDAPRAPVRSGINMKCGRLRTRGGAVARSRPPQCARARPGAGAMLAAEGRNGWLGATAHPSRHFIAPKPAWPRGRRFRIQSRSPGGLGRAGGSGPRLRAARVPSRPLRDRSRNARGAQTWARPPKKPISIGPRRPQGSRTATVIRVRTHSRPASSEISTSHTHVVRPRWRRVAVAWIVPCVIGRRKLVWFERPTASLPSG